MNKIPKSFKVVGEDYVYQKSSKGQFKKLESTQRISLKMIKESI